MDIQEIAAGIGTSAAFGNVAAKVGVAPEQAQAALQLILERVVAGQGLDGLAQNVATQVGLDPAAVERLLPSVLGLVEGHAANANEGVQGVLSGIINSLRESAGSGLLSALDANQDGSVVDDALNAVKGLLDANKDGSVADDALRIAKGLLGSKTT